MRRQKLQLLDTFQQKSCTPHEIKIIFEYSPLFELTIKLLLRFAHCLLEYILELFRIIFKESCTEGEVMPSSSTPVSYKFQLH